MAVGGNIDRARFTVHVGNGLLNGGVTKQPCIRSIRTAGSGALYAGRSDLIRRVSLEGRPWGMTSLYDAVRPGGSDRRRQVQSASRTARDIRMALIRAVVTAPEVSGIASSIDVPVYLITVVSPLDRPGESAVVAADGASTSTATFADLARWTGGSMRVASVTAHTLKTGVTTCSRNFGTGGSLTFEPGPSPGWHPLEIRTRNRT